MSKPDTVSVSVAMATYNGARYIREQLDDLAAQTHLPAELVVCDDGSSDDTIAIVEEFAASASFPVHIHRNPERLGYRANFMKAAASCTSDLIAFCDQDDRWDPGKLELLAAPFADDEVLVTYHNARVVGEDARTLGLLFPARRRGQSFPPLSRGPWYFPSGFTQMFRASLRAFDDLWPLSRDHDEPGERLAHDRWYFFLAGALGRTVYVPYILADYRQHTQNSYGLSWFRTRAPKLTELWHATHKRNLRASAAVSRAQLLRQASGHATGDWACRAAEAAAWYDHIAALGSSRMQIYDGERLAQRASAFGRLVRERGYGSSPAQYSLLALAMDATIGIGGAFPQVEAVTRRLTGH
jgi:glycosyltransferase involved in cell wall biosynthesis